MANKELAVSDFKRNIIKSWTYEKLTKEEIERLDYTFAWAVTQKYIKGTHNQRYDICQIIYYSFINALGYNTDPVNWRE